MCWRTRRSSSGLLKIHNTFECPANSCSSFLSKSGKCGYIEQQVRRILRECRDQQVTANVDSIALESREVLCREFGTLADVVSSTDVPKIANVVNLRGQLPKSLPKWRLWIYVIDVRFVAFKADVEGRCARRIDVHD